MALPLIPLILIGGGAVYVATSSSGPAAKARKKAKKAVDKSTELGAATAENFLAAAEWMQDRYEARRRALEGARWRVLRLPAGMSFSPDAPGIPVDEHRTRVGNEIVFRVGTKDRTDPVREKYNRLYPVSASDEIGYNYYRVVAIQENEYDKDKIGQPVQKQIFLERVYDDLPGPNLVSFFRYESKADVPGVSNCSECALTDAALLEYQPFGGDWMRVNAAVTSTAAKGAADELEVRYPRPNDLPKVARVKQIYDKLSAKKRDSIRKILGDSRYTRLIKILTGPGTDAQLDSFVDEVITAYESLPGLEQGKLAYQAQSALGRDNIGKLIDIFS